MDRLAGKVALITGGNSGIGLATARRFVKEGAFVFITGRRQAELEKAAAELGPGARALQGDVAKLDELDRIIATIRAEKGHLDVVFANAGIGAAAPLGSITEESFDRTFGINVKGVLFTVQKALPLLRPGGSIILNGSTAGSMGAAALSVYSATKAALRSFARCWALDLKATGIRVNVLSPGATVTPGLVNLLSTGSSSTPSAGEYESSLFDGLKSQIPIGRTADPAEIAGIALFLASDDSSYMTGGEVFADGGAAQV
jgi:NAD(P)-dependent dehydrogenase (short-subunit alcohol dehydrogenase family)